MEKTEIMKIHLIQKYGICSVILFYISLYNYLLNKLRKNYFQQRGSRKNYNIGKKDVT